jgi:hypothetical protein
MHRFIGSLLISITLLLFVLFMVKSVGLLLIAALAFGIGAHTGAIGSWGKPVAAILLLLAIPGLILGALGLTLGLLGILIGLAVKIAPLLLVIWCVAFLFKKFAR